MISRFLAEFIMRGRPHAIIVTLLGAWVPLLSQATLGLVALRKGAGEGLFIGLWSLMPVLAALWFGEMSYTVLCIGIGSVAVSYFSASFLRISVSLPRTFFVGAALSALVSLVAFVFVGEAIDQEMKSFFERFIQEQPQGSEQEQILSAFLESWNSIKGAGFLACSIVFSSMVALLVSRWWQGLLFNPGGFQQEFHSLSVSKPEVIPAFLVVALLSVFGSSYEFWLACVSLPLVMIGLGIVHKIVKGKRQARLFLVALYGLLLMIPKANVFLVLLALTDAWLDYRKRFNTLQ